jgi:thioredoxin 1
MMTRVFDAPIHSSDQSFERVLAAGLPVATVFSGRELAEDLDQTMRRLAREHAGKALLVRVRADENPRLTAEYRVERVPWVLSLRGGATIASQPLADADALEAHLAHLLGEGPLPTVTDRSAGGAEPRSSSAGMHREPLAVSDASFAHDVLHSALPVLVDFWAPWCAPCRMVAPTVEKLAREEAARLRVAKLNVDDNPVVAGQFGVTGIPTMILFQDGKVVDRWTGALPESSIRARLARWM